ncbi:MAG TPA: phage regulatory CII family protein, partial [Methyloradius sp.]
RVLHAMAFTLNHAAVEMPEIPDLSDMGIMDAYMEAAEADAIVVAEFRKAYADGQIDDKEFERIKAAQYEAIGKRLAWLAEIERITRMTPARGQS